MNDGSGQQVLGPLCVSTAYHRAPLSARGPPACQSGSRTRVANAAKMESVAPGNQSIRRPTNHNFPPDKCWARRLGPL
jgi:hypothetical protein